MALLQSTCPMSGAGEAFIVPTSASLEAALVRSKIQTLHCDNTCRSAAPPLFPLPHLKRISMADSSARYHQLSCIV
eukprot:1161080-Pelagomonas_calceolata.AAC.6